ncbi:SCO family protein [Falsirhodobacter halotolerans]|uniref:SCO family protein n=1 Tax=Falsirhodobacter halotolerans TaxID=1146892 RepID=UPI001FD15E31|nr:SCO family protein [Falsirhodobacter halotolerans]MCJ8139847.1 SCO family protein [Falsirhodobacter halotolerans]
MSRYLPIFGGVLAALAVCAALWFMLAPRILDRADGGIGRGDYVLETTAGEKFTQSWLAGKPTAVFFGFTHCPDVCPTTLGDIMGWQEALGDRADGLRIAFVTVDPQRDTVAMLNDYVSWLPNAVGVTGSEEEVKKAEKAFGAYSRAVPISGGDYTMEHTSKVILFDRNGTFNSLISYQEATDSVLAKIEPLL